MTTRPSRRRTALAALALAAVALTAAATAGCSVHPPGAGDDAVVGFDPGWDGDRPLLRGSDLGPGYRNDPGGGEDLSQVGCLGAVTAIGTRAAERTSVTFTTENPFDSPVVTHAVLAFDGAAAAAGALAEWRDAARGCDAVEQPAGQGSTLRLDIVTDTERYGAAVEEEVNLVASGGVDSAAVDIGANQWVSVARVDDHLSVVQVFDLARDDAVEEGRRLALLTADRLGGRTAGR